MSDLADLTESFKREVAVPGEFTKYFPLTTDDLIAGALADAFSECQLDNFFASMALDVNTGFITPDLSNAGAALVIFYAGMRTIRSRIRELRSTKYVAGPVQAESLLAISALVEELKMLESRKQQFINNALSSSRIASTYVMDSYPCRGVLYGGFNGYEYPSGGFALGGFGDGYGGYGYGGW